MVFTNNIESVPGKPVWIGYQKEYLQLRQHEDKLLLKEAMSHGDKEEAKKISKRIHERKIGPKGLRSLDRITKKLNKELLLKRLGAIII